MAEEDAPTTQETTTTQAAPTITLESLMASNAAATAAEAALVPAAETEAAVTKAVQALSAEDQQKATELAAKINFGQQGIEQSYGADAQRNMATFSDGVLAKVSSKDTGEAGELLRELLTTVDDTSLSGIKKIPIIGKVTMKIEEIRREYQKVTPQVDEIVGKLERNQAQMVSDIAMYDKMYDQAVTEYRQLKIYVAAGRQALVDFRRDQLPQLEAQAAASTDPMASQVLKDFKDKLDRFDKHLDDLDRVSVVALQSCPQIKILQNADKTVVDKISTTVNLTIPLWKSQMVIALGLENQRRALELQNAVDETTNKLIRQNAEQLHQGAVAAEKANQRGVIDVDTLQAANDQLIATIKETIEIQQEGRKQREEAQVKMRKMEDDLKTALMEQARKM